ncbi:TPA: hypothetical protein DDZ86_02415 [Candidatus Dependentiae bacterium]|nr:MAG: Peptidase M50 [candidate division TM6 bacterium GW2011_GWF2_43_87]HBL98473.1 hypothetical protein [Candidatus Dependentiae bacterium]
MKNLKLRNIAWALLGINIVLAIHELGHWAFCKLFGVATPEFSVGFGPVLFETKFAGTRFVLSLFPIGGYVEIFGVRSVVPGLEAISFAAQPLYAKVSILLGGIGLNLLFALLVFSIWGRPRMLSCEKEALSSVKGESLIGPIGIVTMLARSVECGWRFFVFFLAVLSLNLAVFNLVPIPVLDGGQLLLVLTESLFGVTIREESYELLMLITIFGLALLFFFLAGRDLKRATRGNSSS